MDGGCAADAVLGARRTQINQRSMPPERRLTNSPGRSTCRHHGRLGAQQQGVLGPLAEVTVHERFNVSMEVVIDHHLPRRRQHPPTHTSSAAGDCGGLRAPRSDRACRGPRAAVSAQGRCAASERSGCGRDGHTQSVWCGMGGGSSPCSASRNGSAVRSATVGTGRCLMRAIRSDTPALRRAAQATHETGEAIRAIQSDIVYVWIVYIRVMLRLMRPTAPRRISPARALKRWPVL